MLGRVRHDALALVLCLLGACDAAHDGHFRGPPALALDGRLDVLGEGSAVWGDGSDLTVALEWHTNVDARSRTSQRVLVDLRFPDAVRLVLDDPPPREAIAQLQGIDRPIAIGQLVVFADLDGDGAFAPNTEPLFGVSTAAIVFAEAPVTGRRLSAPAGFSLQRLRGCRGVDGLGGVPIDRLRLALYRDARAPFEASERPGTITTHCLQRDTFVCEGLAERRPACLADPRSPTCLACALGVYPEGASAAECDLWHNACAFHPDYDPDECESEWQACVASAVTVP